MAGEIDETPVNNDLLVRLIEIRKAHRLAREAEVAETINYYYKHKFPNVKITNINKGWNEIAECSFLSIDHYRIDFNIDRFNNFFLVKKPLYFPLTHLRIFRDLLNTFHDNDKKQCYQWRVGTGFFISYFEYCNKEMDLDYVKWMISLDREFPQENSRSGFVQWLLGDSYTRDGNISYYRKFNKSELLTFKESLDAVHS